MSCAYEDEDGLNPHIEVDSSFMIYGGFMSTL